MKKLDLYSVTLSEGKTTASVNRSLSVLSWIEKPGTVRSHGVDVLEWDTEAVVCKADLKAGDIVGFDGLYYSIMRLMTGMAGMTKLFLKQDKNPDVA